MLDGEDLPVPLPLIRLHAQIGRAEAGKSGHFGRGQKISAVQNGSLGLNQHARLLARRLRWSDVGQEYVDDLFQGLFLPLLNQLRQKLHDLVDTPLGRRALLVIREGHRHGPPLWRAVELPNHVATRAAQYGRSNILDWLDLCHEVSLWPVARLSIDYHIKRAYHNNLSGDAMRTEHETCGAKRRGFRSGCFVDLLGHLVPF